MLSRVLEISVKKADAMGRFLLLSDTIYHNGGVSEIGEFMMVEKNP
jgi:hypothetical protein